MSKQTNKKPTFSTAIGVAQYPWLNVADTQFDATGKYKCNLRLSKDEAKPLMDDIRKAAKDAFADKATSATLPFQEDDQTGEIVFKTSSKYQPKMCDATGAVIPAHKLPQIFGGSKLKLAGTMFAFQAGGRHGISLQLGACQLIQLSENSATAGIQFEKVDGGFVAANDNEGEGAEEGSYNF